MSKKYNTRQRSSVLDFFENNEQACFTAKQLIEEAKLDLGEATIYRTLSKLTEEGTLNKYISDNGKSAYYQYNSHNDCDKHFHLKCLKCGQTVHMDCNFMSEVKHHLSDDHNFILDNKKTVIYGTCKNCK